MPTTADILKLLDSAQNIFIKVMEIIRDRG
jgi:hypothetical protein